MRGRGGQRIEWAEIPPDVRGAVEGLLGARVAEARNEPGGFSPGLAARCRLADGRRVFVKAVSPEQNPQSARIHRREVEVAAQLPEWLPAPRLRHVHDDGHWVALVFDEIHGRQPDEPWRIDDLDRVMPAVVDFSRRATPTPVSGLQTAVERHRAVFDGWRRLAGGDGSADGLDDWTRGALETLAQVEEAWEEAAEGGTLVHADLRADNILIGPDDAVTFVDWPWACSGAPFLDLVFLLPSVGLGGGPPPDVVIDRYGLFRDDDPDAVRAVAVAVAGFFQRAALDPPPQGIPHLRAFQQAQAEVAIGWVRRMLE